MAITTRKLGKTFVAEVRGVDLRTPINEATFEDIRAAFHEYAVLVFPGQDIDDEQQLAFSERFGPLEVSIRKDRPRHVRSAEVSDISNIDEDGRLLHQEDERRLYNAGNQMWHTDSSFKPVPAMASLLSGREVPPEGGETQFADLRAAWDALAPDRQAAVEGAVAEHSIIYSRRLMGYDQFTEADRNALPPVQQAVVRTHPETGRKNLYLGSHASHILGRPIEEGRALLKELLGFATQPDFVHTHRWRPKDLVMWDNRCVLHRGRPWDDLKHRRVMHRTTVAGAGPTAVDGHIVEEHGRATA